MHENQNSIHTHENGDLTELVNTAIRIQLKAAGCGISLIQPAGDPLGFHCTASGLYVLELTSPAGEKRLVSSTEAVQVETRKEVTDEGLGKLLCSQRLTLNFTHRPDAGSEAVIHVLCSVRLPASGSASEWFIEIKNQSGYAIQKVKYPLVVINKRAIDSSLPHFHYSYDLNADYTSALLLGLYDGTLIPEPHDNIPDGFGWVEEHPGRMSTQLTAYYDLSGGLCLFTKDGTGSPKLLGFEKQGSTQHATLDITPAHLFPREFGADACVEYPTCLAPFTGDWQSAADTYKRWAVTQAWTREKLSERQDLPGWLTAGYPLLLYVQQRPGKADHHELWKASTPRQMLPVLRKYEQWFGSPLVAIIFGWEKLCSWITPDVFPPYPSEEDFRALVSGLKENGSRVLLYNSGTRWAVKNPRVPGWDGMDYWEKEGRQASCVSEDGGWSYDSRPWALNHKLCMGAQGTTKMMDHYVEGFARLGIDATQYDQNLGGETYVCFSDQHGHPPGYGHWMYDEAKKMLQRFLAESRKHNPDFAVSVEEPNEVLIPYLTVYDSRSPVYHGWPLLTNMPCLGVPLFTYLYHEYAIGFAGDYGISLKGRETDVVKIGRIVSSGHLPCDFIQPAEHWEGGEPADLEQMSSAQMSSSGMPPSAKPAFRLFKNASVAYRTYAHDFLVLGKMLPAPEYRVNETFELFKAQAQSYYNDDRIEYVHPESAAVKAPAVFVTAWLSPAGKPACVLVNMSEKSQKVELSRSSLSPEWGGAGDKMLVLENLEGESIVELAGILTVELPGLQVSVLRFAREPDNDVIFLNKNEKTE